jgi:hypothetical protein
MLFEMRGVGGGGVTFMQEDRQITQDLEERLVRRYLRSCLL